MSWSWLRMCLSCSPARPECIRSGSRLRSVRHLRAASRYWKDLPGFHEAVEEGNEEAEVFHPHPTNVFAFIASL